MSEQVLVELLKNGSLAARAYQAGFLLYVDLCSVAKPSPAEGGGGNNKLAPRARAEQRLLTRLGLLCAGRANTRHKYFTAEARSGFGQRINTNERNRTSSLLCYLSEWPQRAAPANRTNAPTWYAVGGLGHYLLPGTKGQRIPQ